MVDVRFSPMLASTPRADVTADSLLDDGGWALEVKADGERCAVVIADGNIVTFGRNGQRRSRGLPVGVSAGLAPLKAHGLVLDGELVGDTLFLFDLVTAGDTIGPWYPYEVRRAGLDALLAALPAAGAIRGVPYATTAAEKRRLVRDVVDGRGEGFVAKRIESVYTEGARSRDWVKVKRHHEIDCVVTWLGTAKANMGVGVYIDGRLEDVGEVGRLTGDGARCSTGCVVSVRCAYVTDTNRLIQPTLPRLRTDKNPSECTADQFDGARRNPLLLHQLTEMKAQP